ncbi:class I SAM-dependent methyltransferase [Paenibacillus eucommiae]|uniref:SAM-dependent methyltransferase n=1 Tax=Paenibacillus eucommiae TaxID=1355755 RepID=A0ABS4IQ48_9BACL|nr:class I SAM-dependent methyltransferase [Paenibacillus eucommiae]MBP1989693.1 SAM-dependent methyltransferase [Paenibacillus eucommiae]
MKMDKQFLDILSNVHQDFSGWDFSYITATGRMGSQLLSWSYGSMAIPLIQKANSMLDMGTGGGELLSMLSPLPKRVFATEGYLPNVPIARKRLEPLGVKVVQIDEDSHLPFEDNQFDLILNKHESYCPEEIRRIISDDGIFLTQQSGGLDCREINETFGVPLNEEFNHWNLETAVLEIEANGFEVLTSKEEFPLQRFYDVGSLIYYLKAIPWQVPGFEPEKYLTKIYEIHQIIQEKGFFDVSQHRFIIKSRPI